MHILKCPNCDNGTMQAIKMQRGWQKDYLYKCDLCEHEEWIPQSSLNDHEIIKTDDNITDEELQEIQQEIQMKEKGFAFFLFPFVFLTSIIAAIYLDNSYFFLITLLSLLYAFKMGFFHQTKNIK